MQITVSLPTKNLNLFNVGRGTRSDYQDLDVKDKLVLIVLDEYTRMSGRSLSLSS